MRRQRKARAKIVRGDWQVQFIPGGFYWCDGSRLLTGVHRRIASAGITERLLPLAKRAVEARGEWTL